jgi:nitroreductase
LIGVADQHGVEAEHPDALMAVYPSDEVRGPGAIHLNLPDAVLDHLRSTAFTGRPNRLSKDHHPWPIIDAVAAAAAYDGTPIDTPPDAEPPTPSTPRAERDVNARRIIRGRRSAVSMDGKTEIPAETFYHMLDRLTATTPRLPYDVLPWRPRVSLALFVHRVVGVAPGIYLLIRHPSHEPSLRVSIRPELAWARPADCPEHIPLVRLLDEDVRDLAGFASCQQAIAADGVFAAAMLAQLEPALTEYGPWFYPRLFWETGLIGQVLYLEAEAAGIRGTGMGCFYDDVVHETLGLPDRTWQSLYHFTVGGAREDLRLQTLPAYAHLTRPGT